MAEFYHWPEAARLLMSVLLALCMLMQAVALVFSHYRHPRSRSRILENLLELCVLLHIFICVLLHGEMLFSYEIGLIAPTGHVGLRYAVFALAVLLALLVVKLIRKPWPLSVIAAACLTLPAMEAITGNAFAYLLLGTMLFWLLRGVHIVLLRTREIKSSLSALSIKNAIDSLHTGVLFGEADGFILLANRQMQRLMVRISGKVRRNGWVFHELLASGAVEPGCRITECEGQIVCLLDDDSAWMFSKTELHIKRKPYIQLTAADITERWKLTAQLQQRETLLRQKSDELKNAIARIHILSREREAQRAKMRAHDILGQRLTLLLRSLRSEKAMDAEVLRALSQGLLDDLMAREQAPSAQEALYGLIQAFTAIGVNIKVHGELPHAHTRGQLFADIIREGVTNAVRHGFATEISVEMASADGGHSLRISNNGNSPRSPITEGGGIGGMRQKIAPYGGTLAVSIHPRFVLTVDLPGGVQNG